MEFMNAFVILEDLPVIFIGVGILNSEKCSIEKHSGIGLELRCYDVRLKSLLCFFRNSKLSIIDAHGFIFVSIINKAVLWVNLHWGAMH